MSAFWKHLHRLSQDQLFARGHLSPRVVAEIAARRRRTDAAAAPPAGRGSVPPWPRLAACR